MQVSKEHSDFMMRRVRPLLDRAGTQTRTLEHLLAEAYRIGMADAVDVMSQKKE